MAEFYIPIEMKRTEHPNTEFRVKVETTPEVGNLRTYVRFEIQYKHSGETEEIDDFHFNYKLNNKEYGSGNYKWELTDTAGEWVYEAPFWGYERIEHTPSDDGHYTATCDFELTVKADNLDVFDYIIGVDYHKTVGTASHSWELEKIDMSDPEIADFKVYGDRYGLNVGTSFKASHSVYNITSIVFELTGLTYEQANARVGKVTEADSSARFSSGDTYGLRLKKTRNLTSSNEIFFDLDAVTPSASPLDSGGTYFYSLEITAENGKTHLIEDDFTLPQKVTELTCDSNIEMLPETSRPLNYSVLPTNAEEQSVRFDTTDPTVATVDDEGNITAVADGVCQIIVTTVDGGFTAACTVTVVDTEVFPTLNEIRILTSTDISRIAFACKFVRDELIAQGIAVPELADTQAQGKGHPIKQIKSLIETIEANCQILRAASPVEITTLTGPQTINKYNEDWYIVVNNWIAFLNEIHTKINGGG